MKTVKIGELKAKLSAHLNLVKNGEEVIVCERNKPIARIVPMCPKGTEDYNEQMQRLIAKGVIEPAREPMPEVWPGPAKGRMVPDEVMEQIWREERDGR